jgi:hypothetical protein
MKKSLPRRGKHKGAHNYERENAWEDTPAQVKRREARNNARRKATRSGRVHKGDGKELDHVGYHRTGSLRRVPTVVTSRHANRVRQPPHKSHH